MLFQRYPPKVLALLPRYEGVSRTLNAIIRFPSREAALGLYHDPDYQEATRTRQESTANCTMVVVEEFAA